MINRRSTIFALVLLLAATAMAYASLTGPVGSKSPAPLKQSTTTAVPIVDMEGGCLLGGSVDGKWVKAEEMATRMSGGDKYRLFDLKGEDNKNVTGGKPKSQGPPCEDTLYVDIPQEFFLSLSEGKPYIGFPGKWNPMPRIPKSENTNSPVYRNVVAAHLRSKGIGRPDVKILKIVRIDLEGDGVEEVLIQASRVNRWGNSNTITPDPSAGDYSFVMLRKMNLGKVQNIMLDEEYHKKTERFTAPDEFKLVAVLDLNGDGVMEVITSGEYYEGNWKTVYEIKGNKAVDVIGCGCGA